MQDKRACDNGFSFFTWSGSAVDANHWNIMVSIKDFCFHSSAWIVSLNVYWTLEMLQLQMYNYFLRNSSSATDLLFFAFSLKMQMPGPFINIFRRFVYKALENLKWSSPTTRTRDAITSWRSKIWRLSLFRYPTEIQWTPTPPHP